MHPYLCHECHCECMTLDPSKRHYTPQPRSGATAHFSSHHILAETSILDIQVVCELRRLAFDRSKPSGQQASDVKSWRYLLYVALQKHAVYLKSCRVSRNMANEWLHRALKLSLKATAWTDFPSLDDAFPAPTGLDTSSEHASTQDEQDSKFGRLVASILFSRRFILSYPLVLLGVILVFTALHWGRLLRRSVRRRQVLREQYPFHFAGRHEQPRRKDKVNAEAYSSEGWHSSSSSGSVSPQVGKTVLLRDEETPLLPTTRTRHYTSIRPLPWLSSWLVYQPRPIPVTNETLPSNGTTLLLLGLIAINVFYLVFKVDFSIDMLFVFADRASLVFVANLPLLYLLAAKNQPLRLMTGSSYETLNIFHRRLGTILCIAAALHSVGMIGVWYTVLRPEGMGLVSFLLKKIIVLGLGAFIAFEVLYFTSLGTFRQRWYELFLGLHISLQILALVLLYFHHHNSRPYVLAALGIFLVDRFIFRIMLKSHTLSVQLMVLPDGDTVMVSANWAIPPKTSTSRLLATSVEHGWQVTDHIFLTVPALSRKHFIQAHPFTIASSAPGTEGHAWFSLIIRAQDGFSRDLVNYARNHPAEPVTVRLDGPYGSSGARDTLEDSDSAIIVAGGSGIAVSFPIVWGLLNERRSRADVGATSKSVTNRKVSLIWCIRHESHIEWIGYERLQEFRDLGADVTICVSSRGRPDIAALVRERVENWSTGRTAVVCSGPDGMNRDVRNACSGLVAAGYDVAIQIEKFGW